MKQYLEAGQIVGTHGIKGEVRVNPWCDSPHLLADIKTLYFDEGKTPVKVKSRPHKNVVLMIIEGVGSIYDAEKLKGTMLYLNRDDFKLEEDSFFVQDLVGIEVVDFESGHSYGKIIEVSNLGASDIYHVENNGGELLIPAIPDIIIERDFEKKIMKIRVIPGLFEEEII